MTKILQELIGAKQPLFAATMHDLERASGRAGVDVRLIADITTKAHAVMRRLGLDPADTTADELYHTLSARGDPDILADTDYVGLIVDGGVISFNMSDISTNRTRVYEQRTVAGLREALRHELTHRYTGHARTDNTRVKQLIKEAGMEPQTDATNATLNNQDNKPNILCIGDIITDAFIKLSEDHAEETTDDKGYKRLTFELGAKLPYDGVDIVEAVECSPNAAVSLSRLGLNTSLVSWIGDDEPGHGMIEYLKKEGVGTDDLVVEEGMKSNYHYVLRYGADRTKLQRFEDYSYQWKTPTQKPDWVYLGVLGEKTWPLHEAILDYLVQNPEIKLVFQPGMYHLMWGTEKMAPFYKHAEIVIMNREEAAQVTGKDRDNIEGLIAALHDLGVTVAVVTDGADGAYASDGTKSLFMPNYPDPAPPYDRTGAGDAFASTIVAALALGHPLETAMTWAPINSMSVVQQLGAQAGLLTQADIEKHLAEAPADYKPKDMN